MPHFDGLNLTWETLEGLVKHNGPLTDRDGRAVGRYAEHGVPARDPGLQQNPGPRTVVSPARRRRSRRLSDDIAYDAHDIDDGLRADLFTLDDIAAVRDDRRHRARHRCRASAARCRRAARMRPCAA